MDHLLRSQWIRLNEMQGLQLEMLPPAAVIASGSVSLLQAGWV